MKNYDPKCLEEKIISDLSAIMKKDSLLEEFDLIPSTESIENRSPIIHVGHNLGIEVWCVKSLFMYCYANYFDLKSVWKQEHYRLERYSRTALMLNNNISAFWNYRKKLIVNGLLNPQQDFLLTKLILSQNSKSVEALAHRRWLLKQQDFPLNCIENELKLCNQLSNRMKCNYHAWSHRQWVLSFSEDFNVELWLSEFKVSEEWSKCHVSDHCGWHHRQFLLNQFQGSLSNIEQNLQSLLHLLNRASTIKSPCQLLESLLLEELEKNQDLILNFSAHESLWYYRRFVLRKILDFRSWDEESFLQKCRKSLNYDSHQERYMVHYRRWLSDSL